VEMRFRKRVEPPLAVFAYAFPVKMLLIATWLNSRDITDAAARTVNFDD
jgi:hypothetical protein